MYGILCSCGSLDVVENAISQYKPNNNNEETQGHNVSMEIFEPSIKHETESIDTESIDTENAVTNDETIMTNEANLKRLFRENDLTGIYYCGACMWSPYKDMSKPELSINRLYELLINKNMWLVIFDKLCTGFIVPEIELKRIDYFNEMIVNNMIMDNTDDEIKNFGEYTVIGDEPNGAGIYTVKMNCEPYTQILKNITVTDIVDTLSVIRSNSEIIDFNYKKLNKDFMETFFGFTSNTNLFKFLEKYLSEKTA